MDMLVLSQKVQCKQDCQTQSMASTAKASQLSSVKPSRPSLSAIMVAHNAAYESFCTRWSQRISFCHDAIADCWKVCEWFIFSDVMDTWIRTALFSRSTGLLCSHRVIPLWLWGIFCVNMNATTSSCDVPAIHTFLSDHLTFIITLLDKWIHSIFIPPVTPAAVTLCFNLWFSCKISRQIANLLLVI